ncbi:MAG: hypothetical protein HC918_04045 [Oscillatoriales cyanobacterium SM2_1_8]|nr:hypothetical protein [Oscillatoriales cyanobacterium SM2_1_8]
MTRILTLLGAGAGTLADTAAAIATGMGPGGSGYWWPGTVGGRTRGLWCRRKKPQGIGR